MMLRQIIASIGLSAVAIVASLALIPRAEAQEAHVLTVVAPDGALWAIRDSEAPTLIRRDLARGAIITDLDWSPVRSEVLLVRRAVWEGEPYDSLVRIDLLTGEEEVLEEHVGPEARLLGPAWSPDGTWGIARVECCLGREVLRFSFPTQPGSPNRIEADDFLPAEYQDLTLTEAGFINAAGEIVLAVHCCLGNEPDMSPAGVYAVPLNFQSSRLITSDDHGLPIGGAADGSWIATLQALADGDGHHVVVMPENAPSRTLDVPTELPLSNRGVVLGDGTIAVSTIPAGVLSVTPRYVDVWALSADGSSAHNLTASYTAGFTAFGFVRAGVLEDTPLEGESMASNPATSSQKPTRIFLSREPESSDDFSAVFPVARGPLTPAEALQALIGGPTQQEQENGYFSELGSMLQGEAGCGADFELTIDAGLAIIRFCRELTSAGVGQDARVISQITATLTQFASIQRVRILDPRGHCFGDMSGEDRCLRE